MVPAFVWAYLEGYMPVALVLFAVAAFTDYLDGYLARKLNLVSNFGKFMDPLADKLLVMGALVCFVQTGRLAAWVVVVMLAREFIITGFRTIAVEKNIVIAAGFSGKLKTVAQMALILAILAQVVPDLAVTVLVWCSVALSIFSACAYVWDNRCVLQEE
jgi:CDP-diacylglycerol--glycerol-3-phosphate 3-phosphatidyltransferase